MGAKVEFKWNSSPEQIAGRIVSDDVKVFAASTWHKLYEPFVPNRTNNLANDEVSYLAEGTMGVIEHYAPYARYQYYGNFNHAGGKNPLATSHWDQAALAAGKGEALAKAIQGYMSAGGSS